MEIKKIMIIAMYFFIQLVLSACNPCESKYLGTYEFKIDSINFFNSSNYYYYDTFVAIDTIHENDYLSFSVILNIAATKIARNNNSFSFGNTCYAYSFEKCFNYTHYKNTNLIDSIVIVSNNDFNNILAENNLNNKFKVLSTINQRGESYSITDTSIINITKTLNLNTFANSDRDYYHNSSGFDQLFFELILKERPLPNSSQRFTIWFYFQDGLILESTTKELYFL